MENSHRQSSGSLPEKKFHRDPCLILARQGPSHASLFMDSFLPEGRLQRCIFPRTDSP